jgi:hypothetical protein
MKKTTDDHAIEILVAHIKKHMELLEESNREIVAAENCDVPLLGKTSRAAVLLAGLLENYYTCCETIFVRISQFFENNLTPDRWHKDLLERMVLEIEPIRPSVISVGSQQDLLEIMRFRHFKRYYFGTAYDWDRLDEVTKRAKRLHPRLIEEINQFVEFLKTVGNGETPD